MLVAFLSSEVRIDAVSDEGSARSGTSYSPIYDDSIQWVARDIGFRLDSLTRHGLRRRTLVILASGHGEAFGENGKEGQTRKLHPGANPTGPSAPMAVVSAGPYRVIHPLTAPEQFERYGRERESLESSSFAAGASP